MPAYNAVTGELLKDFPAPWSRRLRRKKFMEILGTNIDIRVSAQRTPLVIAHQLIKETVE